MTQEGILSRLGTTDLTIRLEGRQGGAKEEASYADYLTLAPEVFLIDQTPNYCGQMRTVFESNESFISFDETA